MAVGGPVRRGRSARLAALALLVTGSLAAADFWVDPETGSMENPGTEEAPWSTLQEVFEAGKISTFDGSGNPKNAAGPVKGGDTIWLRSGYHGSVSLITAYNETPILVSAVEGATAKLGSVFLRKVRGWHFRGLDVCQEYAPEPAQTRLVYVVNWGGPASEVTIEDCDIASVKDASGWSADDWNGRACHGISVIGTGHALIRNRLRNVSHAITLSGDHHRAEGNSIQHIAADGIVCGGNDLSIVRNEIRFFYNVSANHDDAIQFHRGPDGDTPIERARVEGNLIVAANGPFSGLLRSPQGICSFGCPFVDAVVENNVVIVQHHHGISLYNSQGGRIVNNTVLNPWGGGYATGILSLTTGSGSISRDTLVRNNLVSADRAFSGENITKDHNVVVTDLAAFFVDPDAFDFRLRPDSPAIDAGLLEGAPDTDLTGRVRPVGAGVDLGAYEYADDEDVTPPASPRNLRLVPAGS